MSGKARIMALRSVARKKAAKERLKRDQERAWMHLKLAVIKAESEAGNRWWPF